MSRDPKLLWQAYLSLKESTVHLHLRDAAERLEVSEAELLSADPDAVQLECADWGEFLSHASTLGRVMVLTRNDACVHEKKGIYSPATFEGGMGLVLDKGVDLRIFLRHWAHAFAVQHEKAGGVLQRSFQFFDATGTAVHKIFLTDEGDVSEFERLREQYRRAEPIALLPDPILPKKAELPDDQIDVAGFQENWLALKDVHDFHGVMQKFKVSRQQAFRLAPEGHAWTLNLNALDTLFERASETKTPLMIFVGNKGCIQIHTGAISNVVRRGAWLNILDADFNLHLRTDLVREIWLVKKPGDCGMLTSIEVFDDKGESIMTLFGERKPNQPELASWVRLATELGVEDEVSA